MWRRRFAGVARRIGIAVFVLALCFLASVISASGCGPKSQQQAKQAPEKIRVGFSISKTGVYAPAAESQIRAYELWRDEVNSQGGILIKEFNRKIPVELVYYDDQSSTDSAVRIYEKLITTDKVDLLLAPWGTTMHFAVAPIAEKYKVPVVGNTACSVKIRELGSKYFWFTTSCIPDRQMKALVELLKSHQEQIKTVAILYLQDLFPRENVQYLEPSLKEAGFKVVFSKDYPPDIKDLTPLLSQVKALQPDAVLALTYPADSFLFTSQAKEVGLNPKFLLELVGPAVAAFKKTFGPGTDGIVTQGHWSPKGPWQGAKDFYNKYVAKYKERPDYLDSLLPYVSCQILTQAVEKAGTLDKEKIREMIASERFDTINGPVKFTGVENLETPAMWLQWQGDELEIVWPPRVATAKLLIPKPKWK